MKTPAPATLIAGACLIVQTAIAIGCQRANPSPFASLPIHIEKPLGADLRIAGLEVTPQTDRRSWRITVYSTAVTARHPRPHLWVHAYPQESSTYFALDPVSTFAPMSAGQVVKDEFALARAGAFNLYVGVFNADGSLGDAVGLGWVGIGDPETPEYHTAYRFLQEADDTRAAAMLAQTQRAYPNAKLP